MGFEMISLFEGYFLMTVIEGVLRDMLYSSNFLGEHSLKQNYEFLQSLKNDLILIIEEVLRDMLYSSNLCISIEIKSHISKERFFETKLRVPLELEIFVGSQFFLGSSMEGSVAEWSMALVLGTSQKWRGFESHRCQYLLSFSS